MSAFVFYVAQIEAGLMRMCLQINVLKIIFYSRLTSWFRQKIHSRQIGTSELASCITALLC